MGKLTVNGYLHTLADIFIVNIHNGNENIAVKTLRIKIDAVNMKPSQDYVIPLMPVGPLSSGSQNIALSIRPEKGWNMSLVSGTTCTF